MLHRERVLARLALAELFLGGVARHYERRTLGRASSRPLKIGRLPVGRKIQRHRRGCAGVPALAARPAAALAPSRSPATAAPPGWPRGRSPKTTAPTSAAARSSRPPPSH